MFVQAGTEYAIRALMELARLSGNGSVPLRRIAENSQISEHYLYKVFRRLSERGILHAAPGPKRGYRLARQPDEIGLLEVVEAVQGPIYAYRCVEDPLTCARSERCPVRGIFSRMTEAVADVFGAYTLADILEPAAAARFAPG